MRTPLFFSLCLILFGLACRVTPPVLAPPPSGIEAVEGWGRAVVQGKEAVLKGRFAFRFRRPRQGRLEGLDPLKRTLYFLLLSGDEAYFVIPSKKIYAMDDPESLLKRFLGFSLRHEDVIALLSGQWPKDLRRDERGGPEQWILMRDDKDRVIGGRKEGTSFEIRAFFKKTNVPRSIRFQNEPVSGEMKIYSVRFNPPPRPEAFAAAFLKVYEKRTWEEVQEILKRED